MAMAGDGINDAVSARAGRGRDRDGHRHRRRHGERGGPLVRGDLRGIVRARRLSQATVSNIRQNLFFAFAYNSVGVPVAAGVLYLAFGMLLSPILGRRLPGAEARSSVIANALRLRRTSL